jgi:hypothetical protein
MDRRNVCPELEPPAALAERPVVRIGAAPLPFHGEGAAHNRLRVLFPCGVCGEHAGGYAPENQVRSLAGKPGIVTAGSATVGAVAGPWITTPGLAPDVMIVQWNIAKLALRFHCQGRSANIDWPHSSALFEDRCLSHPQPRSSLAHGRRRGRNSL